MNGYAEAYGTLNEAQKRAVDTIEGPVMVVAGPGTGKTQVLALRIAHILSVTDTPPDGILCLTFTNAGVKAMRERLLQLIGATATKVKISTFHAYGLELIQDHFNVVGFSHVPELLDDAATVALFDEVLYARDWQQLRPRSNAGLYYYDLKSLISSLKRDGMTPENFTAAVTAEIEHIKNDEGNISSRGESKGQLKKEAEKKIESLLRTLEAAEFYALYEEYKKDRNAIDYNDVLSLMVEITETSDDAAASIRERFLYVLVDEHQDSSGAQNAFLKNVWGSTERPNLFVVGDDRQLIYGFGGASLAYFESFKHTFGTAALITLTQNYRSTQTILDTAEALLTSSMADGKLIGATQNQHPLVLAECAYPRDEIIAAGLAIKIQLSKGINPDNCAVLVPKNRQVKTAVTILKDMALPVAVGTTASLFALPETESLLSILRILINPHDGVQISRTVLDPLVAIPVLTAHNYLYTADTRKLSVTMLLDAKEETIKTWGTQLSTWATLAQTTDVYRLIQILGEEILLKNAPDDETLRRRVEIIRTLLHLAMSQLEEGNATLSEFIQFIDRLIAYGEDIPLAVFSPQKGIKVLTLHASKGLEFEWVWIAHMDERSFMSTKKPGFVLPEAIAEEENEEKEAVAKRQLYVAITRAKRYCTISYARQSNTGADQSLAAIVEALPQELFARQSLIETEQLLLQSDLREYVGHNELEKGDQRAEIIELVRENYSDRKVSVTTLNTFFECPWKWYFRSLLQLPEPVTESLQIGNVTHKTIEYVLSKKNTIRNEEEISQEISRCAMLEAHYNTSLAERLITQTQKIITAWMKNYLPTISGPYDSEQNLNYRDADFPHLAITGKIDLIEEIISGEVRVTDWKTGSAKTNSDIDKSDEQGRMSALLRQLVMYSYLIDGQSHGDKSVTESRLVFLEAKPNDKNAVQSRKITHADIARLRNDIQDYDRLLKTGEWLDQPCQAKIYGTDDECAYCAMGKRFGVVKK